MLDIIPLEVYNRDMIRNGKEVKKMTKYNVSDIMKRAWVLRKNYSYSPLPFGYWLHRAWEEAKAEVIAHSYDGAKFVNGMEITIDGETRTLNRWTKGGYDRVYINGGTRKGDGFVDLNSGRYYLRKGLAYQYKIADAIMTMKF